MMRSVMLVLATLLSLSAAAATPEPADYRRLNLELVDAVVLPAYTRLTDRSALLDAQVDRLCAGEGTLAEARAAWSEAFDAWQGVQHLRFGPVELFMRGMRMQFWPDPRNSVVREIEGLLAKGAPVPAFDELTVPAQGFPAIEALLYGEPPAPGTPACALLTTIAGGVANMAADTLQGWRGGERPYREVVAQAAAGASHYQSDQEVTQDFFKAAHSALELIADHKLARALGSSVDTAKPQLVESARSGRSVANIRANLAAAEALYLGGDDTGGFSRIVRDVAGDAALDKLLRRAFRQTRGTAESITLPLAQAVVDPAERAKVQKLAREAGALKALFAQRLAPALGIALGFNSLDGD